MARPMKPLVKSGGYYPSRRWTPLVYPGGYTTANGGEQPEPEAVLKTVTGSLIHITDALALPAEALTVNVEPIQAGSGDPSPDNVRPISGRTSVTVTRTGKNLFDKNAATVGKFINASGQEIANSSKSHSELIPVKPSTAYFMNGFGNSGFFAILAVDANKQPIIWYGGESKDAPFTATMPSNCRYVYLNFNTDQIDTMAFYEGNTNEGYIPYQGDTYTIQIGQTVYGGQLDVTQGKIVVDRAIANLFGDNISVSRVATAVSDKYRFQITGINDMAIPPTAGTPTTAVCNMYAAISADATYIASATGVAIRNSAIIFIFDEAHATDTADNFKAYLQTAGAYIVYELATPFEITLTPTQIDMLLGENNLWADVGDSTLTYYAEGEASTSEALGILLGGTYNNPGGADDVSDNEALGILLGGS